MSEPRLKTEIRVAAQLRRASAAGVYATIARRGDADAGAMAIKIYLGARRARLFVEARGDAGEVVWREPLGSEADEADIDQYIEKEARFDRDLWVVEVEDRDGRTFVD